MLSAATIRPWKSRAGAATAGAGPHHIRAVAEGLGRTPPASRFSPDMSKHAFFGTDDRVPREYKEYAAKL